jgi:hypothetical protein
VKEDETMGGQKKRLRCSVCGSTRGGCGNLETAMPESSNYWCPCLESALERKPRPGTVLAGKRSGKGFAKTIAAAARTRRSAASVRSHAEGRPVHVGYSTSRW